MRVIASFLSGKDQKEHGDELVQYFYETFLQYIGTAPPPYTLEQVGRKESRVGDLFQLRENIKRYYPLVRLLFAIPQSYDQNKANFDEETEQKVGFITRKQDDFQLKELLLEKMEHILNEILACNERNRKLKEGKDTK